MRSFLVALAIFLAAGATGAFFWLSTREAEPPGREADPAAPSGNLAPDSTSTEVLRRWQTTATLVEDLRDALADPACDLLPEWRRVSDALRPHAAWVLDTLAPGEASPRVRALVVLAAGVHLRGSPALLAFARDREEVVRLAAAAAREGRPEEFLSSLRR